MRLVDADKQLEWVDCMTPIHGIGLEPVVAVETVRDLIKGTPTIGAIPVEWIKARWRNEYSERAICERWLIEDWQEEQEAKHEQTAP